jgi:hypothetical protein
MVIVNSQSKLLEVVAAAHSTSRFTGCLNGREEEAHKDADNRDDDQEFDQCET